MMNKIIKLFVANLLLATSVLAFSMSTISSWNIPEGEVAQVKIGDNVVWPPVPYITDGLVSWWDGKWNTGIGLHSDSTTVWKDLIGGRDATILGNYTWSNDTWNVISVDSDGLAIWNGANLPENQTWQLLIHPTNGVDAGRLLDVSYGPTMRLGGTESNAVSIYSSYGLTANGTVPWYKWFQLHQHTLTHEKDSPFIKYYLDGRLVMTWTSPNPTNSVGKDNGRFADVSTGTRGIDAFYYSVRLYDRILSDDEIYQSYVKDCERFNLQQRYYTYAKDAWLWADLADDYTLYTNSAGTQFATEIGDIVLRNRSKTMSNANYNVVANMKRTEDGLVGTNIIENAGTAKGVRIESTEALYSSNTPLDNIEFATIVVTKNERSDTFTSANQARIYLGNYSKFAYLYYSAASLYYTAMQSSSSGKRIYLPSRGYFGSDPVIYGIRIKSVNGEFNTKISVNGVVFIDESGTVPEDIINLFNSNYRPAINYNESYYGMSSDYCEWLVWNHVPENWDDIESQLIEKYNAKKAYEYDIPGWTKYYFSDGSISNRFIHGSTTQEFRENQDVVNVMVGTNTISIGPYSLSDCKSLTNIVFPDNGNLQRIYYLAFRYCTNLTSVVIPESCTRIDYSAFFGCYGLTNVVLPDTLTQLGYTTLTDVNIGAFQSCTSLSEIRIPNSLTILGNATFQGCTNLSEVSNTKHLTYIGERAFKTCENLKEFTFGENIETLGTNMFLDSGIQTIKYYKKDTETNEEAEARIKALVEGTGLDIADKEFICLNYDYAESAFSWIDLTDEGTMFKSTTIAATNQASIGDEVLTCRDKITTYLWTVSGMVRTEDGLRPTNIVDNDYANSWQLYQNTSGPKIKPANTDWANMELAFAIMTCNDMCTNRVSTVVRLMECAQSSYITRMLYNQNGKLYSRLLKSNGTIVASIPGIDLRRLLQNKPTLYVCWLKVVDGVATEVVSINGKKFTLLDIIDLDYVAGHYFLPGIKSNASYSGMPVDYQEVLFWDHIPEDIDNIEKALMDKYNIEPLIIE